MTTMLPDNRIDAAAAPERLAPEIAHYNRHYAALKAPEISDADYHAPILSGATITDEARAQAERLLEAA